MEKYILENKNQNQEGNSKEIPVVQEDKVERPLFNTTIKDQFEKIKEEERIEQKIKADKRRIEELEKYFEINTESESESMESRSESIEIEDKNIEDQMITDSVSVNAESGGENTEGKEKEISPEMMKQAEQVIWKTLGIKNSSENLVDNFDEILKEATKSLTQYQKIEEELKGIESKELSHELFKIIKKDSDKKQDYPEDAPNDGVLIESMKQGKLQCSGRTLIASTFLQEHGIKHTPVTATGHAFLIIEQPDEADTLIYFDANNNLYFTFPKSALEGYNGVEESAECKLKDYTPREKDFFDGVNTVFSNFVVMPAQEAVGRQYLGNVAAALDGNDEFKKTKYIFDEDEEISKVDKKELSEVVHKIEANVYGEKNEVLENFYARFEGENGLEKKETNRTEAEREVIGKFLQKYSTKIEFIEHFLDEKDVSDKILYIKNASKEQKKIYAENLWDFLQSKSIDKTIIGN